MYSEFGKNVRKALIDKDMNLGQLASLIGISKPYLTDILSDNRKAKKQKKKICNILGIKPGETDIV